MVKTLLCSMQQILPMPVLWILLYRLSTAVVLLLWSIVIFSGRPWLRITVYELAYGGHDREDENDIP